MARRTLRVSICLVAALLCAIAGCARSVERPKAEYDPATGRLRRLIFDANHNGRNDATSMMDGTAVRRIELDLNENGRVDRWDIYRDGSVLDRIGFSRMDDGVMDAVAFYRAADLERIEIATHRDGRFDRVEFYERGALVRAENDIDRDGRPDMWESYKPNHGAAPNEPPYAIVSVTTDRGMSAGEKESERR